MKQTKSGEITDAFWEQAEPLLPCKERDPDKSCQRKLGGGRHPLDPRKPLEAICYVLRTGIPWKALPQDFGASSAVHRSFRFWWEQGFFKAMRIAGFTSYEEAVGIPWAWLSADGCMTKAPLAQEAVGKKRQQTPYARSRKRSAPIPRRNRHEVSYLEAVLDAFVIARPDIVEQPHHWCLYNG
jgi:transposase